jgi:hypothetical protein
MGFRWLRGAVVGAFLLGGGLAQGLCWGFAVGVKGTYGGIVVGLVMPVYTRLLPYRDEC